MNLKLLLLPFLALQFSCSNQVDRAGIVRSITIKNFRGSVIDNNIKPYRFEKIKVVPTIGRIQFIKKQSLLSNNNHEIFFPNFKQNKIKKVVKNKKVILALPVTIKKSLLISKAGLVVTKEKSEQLNSESGNLLTISEQLDDNYEINMNKGFQVYGFNNDNVIKHKNSLVSIMSTIDWSLPSKAKPELIAKNVYKDNEVVLTEFKAEASDSLVTIASSAQRSDVTSDQMIFRDYENVGDTGEIKIESGARESLAMNDKGVSSVTSLSQLVANATISLSVQGAIKRELSNAESTPIKNREDNKSVIPEKRVATQNTEIDKAQEFLSDTESACGSGEHDTGMSIYGYSVLLGEKRAGKVFDYDFLPEYNQDDLISDRGQGCISISKNIKLGSVLRGTFSSRDEIRTKSDVLIDGYSLQVPLINTESLENFLDIKKDFSPGGFVLIEATENISSVELAADYGKKYYFDEFFEESDGDDFQFVLFTGVSIGNTTVQYLTSEDNIVDKIVHIVEDEIYYDFARVHESKVESFLLYENDLFSSNKKLMIDGKSIKFFNSNVFALQKALNLFEINVPAIARGMRKYFELDHLGEVIVMGKGNQRKVSLPSRRFIGQVLSEMNIDDLNGRCMIQVNTSLPVKTIQVAGETKSGPMNVDYQFIDADGNFGKYESDSVTTLFITGEYQGVINARLDYFNGKSEIIQTYCSEETYLVEQL